MSRTLRTLDLGTDPKTIIILKETEAMGQSNS
jgi:hypothetical protein